MRNEKCVTTGISEDTQSAYEPTASSCLGYMVAVNVKMLGRKFHPLSFVIFVHLCYLYIYLFIIKADTSVTVPSYEHMSQTYSFGIVLTPTHRCGTSAGTRASESPSGDVVCVMAVARRRTRHTRQYVCLHAPAPATLCQLLLPEVVWFNVLFDV